MDSISAHPQRVVSGMRSTGRMHLGHYHGVLKNWVRMQHEYECFFFVADWHALTTHYETPPDFHTTVWEMVLDWLACGLHPGESTLFIQSRVPEHAELYLLLSMLSPLGWLERVPTFKDQQEKLKELDLATHGFLGYPVLQAADILLYKANLVPVGEDQVSHLELVRELARRFNYFYGREPDFVSKAEMAITKLGKKQATLYRECLRRYQEEGDHDALATGRALLESQANLSLNDRERLLGYLEGNGRIILPEPQVLLAENAKLPGLDGQKMSKSYKNVISLRDTPDEVSHKVKTMPTDPARARRTDPGDPEKCPVWSLHKVYSSPDTQQWVQQGCRGAGIGCLECKKPLIDAITTELKPIQDRAKDYEQDMGAVRRIVADGCERASQLATETLEEVRAAMGLDY